MAKPSRQERAKLRELIEGSLRRQGFRIRNGQIVLSKKVTKDKLRCLHRLSVQHRVEEARARLGPYEDRLLGRIASGSEVEPAKIAPRLIEVLPDSEDELLFRYASLHWSIPTSSGYGRRLRFLVEDAHNGKLIGLFGLCDPVFSVAARDAWIGWDLNARKARLRNVMEAFILGAVPPYSMLLGGKLAAMLCASDEVRRAFQRKYGEGESLIMGTSASATARPVIVVDLSARGNQGTFWSEELQRRILGKLLSALVVQATASLSSGQSANVLVLLDEAHRHAPSGRLDEDSEADRLRSLLRRAVRETRKYGIGWFFISQTLGGIDNEILQQLRILVFGFGLAMGTEFDRLKDFAGGDKRSLELYQSFRDPQSFPRRDLQQFPFMAVGPVSPLAFSGKPLFFTAFIDPAEFLRVNQLCVQ